MKAPILLSVVLSLVCVWAAWALVNQQQKLTSLEARKQQVLTRSSGDDGSSAPATQKTFGAPSEPAPLELLELRKEFHQLNQRAQELAPVRAENQRLKSQLASRQASAASGLALPPGYIRKSQARMAGYNTPEDTLQTFLWALANKDFKTFLDCFPPEAAQQFQAQMQAVGADKFFEDAQTLPGAVVTGHQVQPDGTTQLMVQFLPDTPAAPLTTRLVNGQWKLSSAPH